MDVRKENLKESSTTITVLLVYCLSIIHRVLRTIKINAIDGSKLKNKRELLNKKFRACGNFERNNSFI